MEETEIRIVSQGRPAVNDGYVRARGDAVALVYVDLASKRCDVDWYGGDEDDCPRMHLRETPESLHLREGVPAGTDTVVELPAFPGWTVEMADVQRYTLRACLRKMDRE